MDLSDVSIFFSTWFGFFLVWLLGSNERIHDSDQNLTYLHDHFQYLAKAMLTFYSAQ